MEVKVSKFDHLGQGIVKSDNKIIFVKRALPNEIIDIDIIKEKKQYQDGIIKSIVKPNKFRCKSICPYYDKCGGCDFLHCNYDLEREFKINKCKELFDIEPIYYDTSEYNYRNKVTLHVKGKKIGFYNEKTYDIVDINYCYLLNDKINNIINKLHCYINNNYCNIEDIIIRSSKETMLIINGNVPSNFIDYFSFVDNIVINDNLIKGNGFINENIYNYKFKISPKSFFQVNSLGLEKIFNILENNLKNKYHKALDLYSGTSVMGILISKFCDKVIGVEVNKSSCNDALENIKNNNITNIEIINNKVENVIDKLNDIDLVIIDPPRSGLDKKTIDNLMKIKAKTIVYISCNMITLKRDLDTLQYIYKINNISLVNMFPKTYHCEVVTVLEKNRDDMEK